VETEELDEFERELKQALQRRPAPPSLKRRVLEQRMARRAHRRSPQSMIWMRLAATLLIVALLGGGLRWGLEQREERRQGEEARRQVMTALRITGHALNKVSTRLAAHDRAGE
jgi:type VI protein secretion system component VasF